MVFEVRDRRRGLSISHSAMTPKMPMKNPIRIGISLLMMKSFRCTDLASRELQLALYLLPAIIIL
jgi:hypothetical protein